jgi:LPXTG-motif cell wall-anchored protein
MAESKTFMERVATGGDEGWIVAAIGILVLVVLILLGGKR